MGKLLSFIGSFIMWFVIIVSLVLMAPRLAGIKSYVVISGSMEPAIPVGSLVYSREVEPSTLEAGDIIVFYSSDAGSTGDVIPVTHRVVANDTATGQITTKGDANENNDISKVAYVNVVGRAVFHIPMLGYLAAPLSSVIGKIAAALLILAGYLLTEAGSSISKKR